MAETRAIITARMLLVPYCIGWRTQSTLVALLNSLGAAGAPQISDTDFSEYVRVERIADASSSWCAEHGWRRSEQRMVKLWWHHPDDPVQHPRHTTKGWYALHNVFVQHSAAITRQLALMGSRVGGIDPAFNEMYICLGGMPPAHLIQ